MLVTRSTPSRDMRHPGRRIAYLSGRTTASLSQIKGQSQGAKESSAPCRLLAQSGPSGPTRRGPLLEVGRTRAGRRPMSAFDPKRTWGAADESETQPGLNTAGADVTGQTRHCGQTAANPDSGCIGRAPELFVSGTVLVGWTAIKTTQIGRTNCWVGQS